MLKRSLTESADAYPELKSPGFSAYSPYMKNHQARKQLSKPGSFPITGKNFNCRKGSSQSQDTLNNNLQSGYSEGEASPRINFKNRSGAKTEQSSPYLRKEKKQIYFTLTSSGNLPDNREAKPELPSATIAHLSEFIDYYLENSSQREVEAVRNRQQMEANPLSILQGRLLESRDKIASLRQKLIQNEQQRSERQAQIGQQVSQIQKQMDRLNIEVLQLVNDHVDHKKLLKTISELEEKITKTEQNYKQKYNAIQGSIKEKMEALTQMSHNFKEKIIKNEYQMEIIQSLRSKVSDRESQLSLNARKKSKMEVSYQQLVKEKSGKDLKQQLANNKQVLTGLYQNLSNKMKAIMNAVVTHSENHQFLSSLELQENEKRLAITKKSNEYSPEEKSFLSANEPEYEAYLQYLKTDIEIKKLEDSWQKLQKKHMESLNEIKNEVEYQKKMGMEQVKKIRDLETMQTIREAQINQLTQILKAKDLELSKLKSQNNSFEIFRSSLVGFGGHRRP